MFRSFWSLRVESRVLQYLVKRCRFPDAVQHFEFIFIFRFCYSSRLRFDLYICCRDLKLDVVTDCMFIC